MTLIQTLTDGDVRLMRGMLAMFAEAFEDAESYASTPPRDAYLAELLGSETFIALAAVDGERVVGGIAAYVLRKFEQQRSEIYLYDIAVAESHRRRGIATALIAELTRIARARGASGLFVQAHREDAAAVAFYSKLGAGEDVLHFELPLGAP